MKALKNKLTQKMKTKNKRKKRLELQSKKEFKEISFLKYSM